MQEVRLALKPHVIVERGSEPDSIVLIDSQSGRMSACNETASIAIAELEAGSTVARLVTALIARFSVSDAAATRDLNAFLDVLTAEGMLDTGNAAKR